MVRAREAIDEDAVKNRTRRAYKKVMVHGTVAARRESP